MELSLAILNGGKGSRMGGRDKGQLRYQGRTLLDRLLDLGAVCRETLVITDDVVPGKGAPGGVVTALLKASTPHVLLVAADMPFVTVEAVQPLIATGGAALFGDDPFPGIYLAEWGPRWRDRLVMNPSMRELVASSPFAHVKLEDPRVVESVNTPEQARRHGISL
jgi:molybdenum cofactor guanylyltransferase